jgi:hypothetical protein
MEHDTETLKTKSLWEILRQVRDTDSWLKSKEIMKNKFHRQVESGGRLCGIVVRALTTGPEVKVRFPEQPDFLRSSGSRMVSTQLHQDN